MTAIRQTAALAATIIRAFIRQPQAVLGMIFHHHFGDRDRAAQLAERVKEVGKR